MNAPAHPVHTLEARYYTDPAIFRAEQASLLASTWQFAGHSSQLENPGDYFTFEIAQQSLFCIRGHDGTIRGFYNVCQHRAHELLTGSGNRKLLACPYHAWTYEIDGRLRAGPNTKAVLGFQRERICLSEVLLEIFCGFIFVNLDLNAKPMADWFPNVASELRAFVPHIDELKPVEWVDVTEHCNWKVSVENYSECYHCAINHPTFASGIIKPETYDIQPQGYCLRHTTQCQNLNRMSYLIDLEANPHAGDYSSWFLWPLFSFQVYPGNVLNTYHWRPSAVDQVTVWRGWYTIGGIDSDLIGRLAVQDRTTTVEEDIRLVESVQRGLSNRGYRPGPLVIDPAGGVKSEHSVQVLQQWFREALPPEHTAAR